MLRNQIKHRAFLNRLKKKKKKTYLAAVVFLPIIPKSVYHSEGMETNKQNKETPQTKLSFQKPACPSEQGRNSMHGVAGAAVLFVLLRTAAAGLTA